MITTRLAAAPRLGLAASTPVRRFAATPPRHAVSPYVLFLKKTKDLFPGKRAAERGKLVAALYHSLPKDEKDKLLEEAKTVCYARKYKVKTSRKTFASDRDGVIATPQKKAATPYNLFFKANLSKVSHIQNRSERMSELGKMWAAHKAKHGVPTPTVAAKAESARRAAAARQAEAVVDGEDALAAAEADVMSAAKKPAKKPTKGIGGNVGSDAVDEAVARGTVTAASTTAAATATLNATLAAAASSSSPASDAAASADPVPSPADG